MTIYRAPSNPILTPADIKPSRPDMEVIGVFNAGVIRKLGEVILLLRIAERPITDSREHYLTPIYNDETDCIEIRTIPFSQDHDFSDPRTIKTPSQNYLTSISHLRVARSGDGIHFEVDDQPTIRPANVYERFGIEDPRITELEDGYYITYTGASEYGIVVPLIFTKDFITFERKGIIFHPDNKDVAIFPERMNGKYYALHRPSSSHYAKPDMWIAESDDLLKWGNHQHLIGVRDGCWDDERIGASAVPFRTEQGWLEIYHGADHTNRYCLGAVLLDLNEPWRVIARSKTPFMVPELEFEVEGFFGNVIFSCGALYEEDKIKIYYGAGDTCIGYAETTLASIMESMESM
ncbi:MAG: glycoside hydrolase family 130 protein [Gorillibacterium sp.]|nr:glycoside hydrolase family 130 protein [Gorillibacterium sp.]